MRTEQEMFNLILSVAENDERIRAVVMNGSRTNTNVIKDIFQDYDIVYVVNEIKPFGEQKNWIDQFGERLYMQYHDENSYYEKDGNRVKKPTQNNFYDICNEFWWCLNNVAKGLWREEIPYVMDMLNYCVRPQLIRLMEWKIGFDTNFTVSVGKSEKFMYRWLKNEI